MCEKVCTIGYGKDNHPPMDHDGFVAFVDSLHQQEASKVAFFTLRQCHDLQRLAFEPAGCAFQISFVLCLHPR